MILRTNASVILFIDTQMRESRLELQPEPVIGAWSDERADFLLAERYTLQRFPSPPWLARHVPSDLTRVPWQAFYVPPETLEAWEREAEDADGWSECPGLRALQHELRVAARWVISYSLHGDELDVTGPAPNEQVVEQLYKNLRSEDLLSFLWWSERVVAPTPL